MIAPWAKEEVAKANIGDKRLNARLTKLLSDLGSRPNMSIPAACRTRAEIKAAYGFFDNDKATFSKVAAPHCDATEARIGKRKSETVLMAQDTTETDLTRPDSEVEGVGELDGKRRGFLLHVLHAFTPDGTPLGTVYAEVVNRVDGVSHASKAEKERERKTKPIEEKESMRWLTGMREARRVAQENPEVQCVCIGDSESDIYEVMAEPRGETPVHWLIRGCQDRALVGGAAPGLREPVLATPVLYEVELKIRERRAETEVEDRARKQSRVARTATVEVRAAPLTLRPPYRPDRKLLPVEVNVVLVREPNPPAGEPAVEWILFTTLPIDTPEQVRKVVEYYCVRWTIEILFRTLKSGCRIEKRRFEHMDRLLPCVALYLIVAWRTLYVCRLSRSCPDMDCEAIFEPAEWKAVWMAVKGTKPPKTPPPLVQMVRMIATLGGFVDRPNQDPGTQTLWIGMQRMYDLAWGWETFGPGAKTRSD